IPHAGRRCKSVSRLLRDASRRPRRNPKPHGPRRSARQKSLRTATGRTRTGRQRSGFTSRGNRSVPGRSFLPVARRRLQRRLHRQLDRHETKRIRRPASPPPPVRVRNVLRRVMASCHSERSRGISEYFPPQPTAEGVGLNQYIRLNNSQATCVRSTQPWHTYSANLAETRLRNRIKGLSDSC